MHLNRITARLENGYYRRESVKIIVQKINEG